MNQKLIAASAVLISAGLLSMLCAETNEGISPNPTPEMTSRSLLTLGDTSRLTNVMLKARQGQKIVVSTIGGSITEGAGATKPENRWANLSAQWWINKFPNTEVQFVNAGIGATGSNIGAHRAAQDLLRFKPDLVIVEFAVNDANTEFAAETLEGLTRQILKQPNNPAVMYIFTTNTIGGNAQEWHSKVGYHYKLPMISERDAVYPEFQSGAIKWEDIMPDGIHPNDIGHKYMADFIYNLLDKVYDSLPDNNKLKPIKRIPKPLISDTFEYTNMFTGSDMNLISNNGWSQTVFWRNADAWESSAPGSTIEFEVEGETISITYFRLRSDMGMADVQIDNNPPIKLNGWFEATWGGYSEWALLARNLEPGKHRVKIRLLHEKAEESKGHKFQILSIMTAGLNK